MNHPRFRLCLSFGLVLLAACELDFDIDGIVVRCGTDDPVVGVRVELFVTRKVPSDTDQTDADGRFYVVANVEDRAITLLLTKPGHETKKVVFPKPPGHEIELCLELSERDEAPRQDAGPDDDAGSPAADR